MADENKELEQFLQDLLDEEQKRHEEFLKGHWELMQMIEEARKEMHKYTAKEVAALCGISESKSYKIIAQLNKELAEKGFLTFRGKVSQAYFNERMYSGRKDGNE